MSVGGWTVADTARVVPSNNGRRRVGSSGGGSAHVVAHLPHTRRQSGQERAGVRTAEDQRVQQQQQQDDDKGSVYSRVEEEEEVDLDKLLEGLEKLTETLPDLDRSGRSTFSPPPRPPSPTISPRKISQHPSSDERDGDSRRYKQPYHTLNTCKPFSYIHAGSLNMPASRNLSRAGSRESLSQQHQPPGLQSPGLLRRIMGGGGGESESNGRRSPTKMTTTPIPVHTGYTSPLKTHGGIDEDDRQASLSWLERQQRKLHERREFDQRCHQLRRRLSSASESRSAVMGELKSSMQHNNSGGGARSETTTDGYASDVTSLIYSEASREASPSRATYSVPVRVSNDYYISTPKGTTTGSSTLTRQRSDASYDRVGSRLQQNHLGRSRLRHDSENNGFHASSTSIDSFAHSNGGHTLSRPNTPGFPAHYGTMGGGSRAPSPGGGSIYLFNSGTTPRRGSVSSEPAEVSPLNVKMARDSHRYWYKPGISRDEAIGVLRHAPPGTFVIRDSNSFAGAFGLALRVAEAPVGSNGRTTSDELIRHFLIEPTSKGVKLKGYNNEPVFASLSALVYQHTLTRLALPTLLVLPQSDLTTMGGGRRGSESSTSSQMQQLLSLGAACNVTYLLTVDTDSLTGPAAIRKAVAQAMEAGEEIIPLLVHFKVSGQGITLTDNARKRFFRKHYNTPTISHCGLDPEDRIWPPSRSGLKDGKRLFAFVAKKPTSRTLNQCHLFAEHDAEQPARAIVNFVNKVMLTSNVGGSASNRADVV